MYLHEIENKDAARTLVERKRAEYAEAGYLPAFSEAGITDPTDAAEWQAMCGAHTTRLQGPQGPMHAPNVLILAAAEESQRWAAECLTAIG